MSAKHDIETTLDEIAGVLSANLNAKIDEIEAEKGGTLVLAPVDSNAYFLQSLDGKQANYDPFVLVQVQNIEGESDPGVSYTPTDLKIAVVIVVADEGQDNDDTNSMSRRMFRYGRALKEVFEENFELPESSAKLKVSSQVPIEVALLGSDQAHRAIGVTLTVELG